MKVLITSGGTKIPIDSVRHIGNMSKGTFPTKIAIEGMSEHKWNLNFLYSDGSKAPHLAEIDVTKMSEGAASNMVYLLNRNIEMSSGYRSSTYKDFSSYSSALYSEIRSFEPDVVVLAAAVSDYGTEPTNGKIRSSSDMTINLTPLPKIIGGIKRYFPNVKLVGFKLLVDSTDEELFKASTDSIQKNGCDMVIANDLRDIKNNKHRVTIVKRHDSDGFSCETYTENIEKVVARAITNIKNDT